MRDFNTTATYAFGYADVTANGSPATYGDAVNPYITEKTAGDGFDLERAVDPTTKMPINVNGKTFHYVRVYSAVLDNATFGETSTEVCGIFTTANGQKTAENVEVPVGRTKQPTIKYGPSTTTMTQSVSNSKLQQEIQVDAAGTYYIITVSEAENIYINGTKVTSGQAYEFQINAGEEKFLRVIAQDGSKDPRIYVVKFTVKTK